MTKKTPQPSDDWQYTMPKFMFDYGGRDSYIHGALIDIRCDTIRRCVCATPRESGAVTVIDGRPTADGQWVTRLREYADRASADEVVASIVTRTFSRIAWHLAGPESLGVHPTHAEDLDTLDAKDAFVDRASLLGVSVRTKCLDMEYQNAILATGTDEFLQYGELIELSDEGRFEGPGPRFMVHATLGGALADLRAGTLAFPNYLDIVEERDSPEAPRG